MAQTPHVLHVKVEVDYERLSKAIRDALQSSMTVTTSSTVDADVAAGAVAREWEWREGGRVK